MTVLLKLCGEGDSGLVEKSWCGEAVVEEERVGFWEYLGLEQPAGSQCLLWTSWHWCEVVGCSRSAVFGMLTVVVKVGEVEVFSSLKPARTNTLVEMSALEHALALNSTPQCVL